MIARFVVDDLQSEMALLRAGIDFTLARVVTNQREDLDFFV